MIEITLPADPAEIGKLEVGDRVLLRGTIFTGRDAALPKLVGALKNGESPIDVQGAAIMHTAVSPAGIAPTSSNKEDIEESIPYLASAGVLVHIGKGKRRYTIRPWRGRGLLIVTPPVAASSQAG